MIQRFIQIVGSAFIIFIAIGGGFFHRQALPDGSVLTNILTLYKSLPPPPAGPSYCDIVNVGDRGLVLPCDLKPPFIGWLQGGKY